MTTQNSDVFAWVYAGITLVGGIIGYAKAGSQASLISGALSATAIGYGAYHTSQNMANCKPIFVTALALLGFFTKRFYESGKMMPSGIMASLSFLAFIRYGRILIV